MARGQVDQDRNLVQRHNGKTKKNDAEVQFGGETMQRMVKTSANAEGRRLEHQEELSKRRRVMMGRKAIDGEESRSQVW